MANSNAASAECATCITRRHFIALAFGSFIVPHASGHEARHPHEPDPEEIALGSLADAELALAALALDRGWRQALHDNAAQDGVLVGESLVPLQKLETSPTGDSAPYRSEPAQIGVSRSYDFGYTTGPYAIEAKARAAEHGLFLRIWQRSSSGPWRILMSSSIRTPVRVDFVALGAAPRPTFAGRPLPVRERETLRSLEASLARQKDRSVIAPDAHVYRDDVMPLPGDDVAEAIAGEADRAEAPSLLRISRSADLALACGRLREAPGKAARPSGYYVHIWLRDQRARWQLAFDMVPRHDP